MRFGKLLRIGGHGKVGCLGVARVSPRCKTASSSSEVEPPRLSGGTWWSRDAAPACRLFSNHGTCDSTDRRFVGVRGGARSGARTRNRSRCRGQDLQALCEEYDKPTNGGKPLARRPARRCGALEVHWDWVPAAARGGAEAAGVRQGQSQRSQRARRPHEGALDGEQRRRGPSKWWGGAGACRRARADPARSHQEPPSSVRSASACRMGCAKNTSRSCARCSRRIRSGAGAGDGVPFARALPAVPRAAGRAVPRERGDREGVPRTYMGSEYLGDLLARDASKSMAEVERLRSARRATTPTWPTRTARRSAMHAAVRALQHP